MSLKVVDQTNECARIPWRGKDIRDPRICEILVIHRIENSNKIGELADLFADPKLGTGGRFPYHFVIQTDGTINQCVAVKYIAPGAVAANRAGIQIASVGDFRKAPPTPAQLASLTELCAHLLNWKPSLRIEGHTEKPGRSSDPSKVCPGKYLDVTALRLAVQRCRESSALQACFDDGIIF